MSNQEKIAGIDRPEESSKDSPVESHTKSDMKSHTRSPAGSMRDLRAERSADRDFDDIVKAIEKMVGAKPGKNAKKETEEDRLRQTHFAPQMSEKQAVETILSGNAVDAPQPTMLEAVIRDMLPPLIEDWLENNMERLVTQTMQRDALQEAIIKVWVENGKKQT